MEKKARTTKAKVKPKVVKEVDIQLRLERYEHTDTYTKGRLYIDGELFCYTLEDQKNATKVDGETRIDAGIYPVKFKDAVTPLTVKYRNRFGWFDKHLEICGLPRHTNVYIHIGNDKHDTDGCVLVGLDENKGAASIGKSTQAFALLYEILTGFLEEGKIIEIEIVNK